MYSYCMDIEFIEALIRERLIDTGYCIMLTNDMAFWRDSGRGSEIHDMFRVEGKESQRVVSIAFITADGAFATGHAPAPSESSPA